MGAQTDFHLTLDRAAGLLTDATCGMRAAGIAPLPHPHRHLLNRAVRKLESAQDDIFKLRNEPWNQPSQRKQPQLALL